MRMTTNYSALSDLMGIWVATYFWLLWVKLLWINLALSFGGHVHLFLCSGMGSGCLVLVDTSKQFAKVIVPIYFPMLTKCLLNEWVQPRRGFFRINFIPVTPLIKQTHTHTRTRFSIVPHCYNLQILNLQVVQGPARHPCVILQFHCLSQPTLSTHHQHL